VPVIPKVWTTPVITVVMISPNAVGYVDSRVDTSDVLGFELGEAVVTLNNAAGSLRQRCAHGLCRPDRCRNQPWLPTGKPVPWGPSNLPGRPGFVHTSAASTLACLDRGAALRSARHGKCNC
jgi:hypothetical protein